jgi:HEAT repeat protein
MAALGDLLEDLSSGDSARAERAALELPKHKEAALQELSQLIQSDDADKRWWAACALAGFAQPAAGDLLTAALADPDAGVRQCAALALSKSPHASAIPALIETLAAEDSLLTRLAADALVALGAAAVEPLIAVVETNEGNAQVEAARALALIGDPRAVPALFKLLDSDSAVLEHWATEGLEKMGVGMSFFIAD